MMKRTVFTIGYEGAELNAFLATLTLAGVEHLLDIRDVPVSRKRGFSKSSLADALATAGIGYTHLKALGDPKPGRDAMKRGDYPAFLTIYSKHIACDEAQKALEMAIDIAQMAKTVLLCYERNPKHCHRTIVAEQISAREDFDVRHLGVNEMRSLQEKSVRCAANGSLISLPA